MSGRRVFQLAGWSLLVGGLVATLGTLVNSFTTGPNDPTALPANLAVLVGVILVLLGVPALYARLYHAIGWVGLIGFALFYISGLVAGIGGSILGLYFFPTLAQVAPSFLNGPPPQNVMNFFLIGGIINLVGGVLFGGAVVVARTIERNAGILVVLGAILSFVGNFVNVPHLGDLGTALFLVALAWMGVTLMTHREVEPTWAERASQPEREVRVRA